TSAASATVTYSNIRVGDIGSTYSGTAQTTTTSKSSTTTTKTSTSTSSTKTTTTTTTTKPISTTSSTKTTTTTTKTTTTTGATQTHYGQCGGQGYTGPTVCASPYTCTYSNAYYSQCFTQMNPGSAPESATQQAWAKSPKQVRIKVVDYFTMKHIGYLCARLPCAVCAPENVDKALTIEFPFTTTEGQPRDIIKLEKSFKRPNDEPPFLCLLSGPKVSQGVTGCYHVTACTQDGKLFDPWDEPKQPQLKAWSLQGVLDCGDPELQALAKGGPGGVTAPTSRTTLSPFYEKVELFSNCSFIVPPSLMASSSDTPDPSWALQLLDVLNSLPDTTYLKVPREFTFPLSLPETSIATLLQTAIPEIRSTPSTAFPSTLLSHDPPSRIGLDYLLSTTVPPPSLVRALEVQVRHALGYRRSVIDPMCPTARLPLWIVTWWAEVIAVHDAQATWVSAERWLTVGSWRIKKDGKYEIGALQIASALLKLGENPYEKSQILIDYEQLDLQGLEVLLFPVHCGGTHWIAVEVDFARRTWSIGDSNPTGTRPNPVMNGIMRWLDGFGKFEEAEPFAIGLQELDDDYSSAICAINAIEHRVWPQDTELWTSSRKGLIRMQWFGQVASHHLQLSKSSTSFEGAQIFDDDMIRNSGPSATSHEVGSKVSLNTDVDKDFDRDALPSRSTALAVYPLENSVSTLSSTLVEGRQGPMTSQLVSSHSPSEMQPPLDNTSSWHRTTDTKGRVFEDSNTLQVLEARKRKRGTNELKTVLHAIPTKLNPQDITLAKIPSRTTLLNSRPFVPDPSDTASTSQCLLQIEAFRTKSPHQGRGPRTNWFSSTLWNHISSAAITVGYPYSARQIVAETKRRDPIMFERLRYQTVTSWLLKPPVEGQPWSQRALKHSALGTARRRYKRTKNVIDMDPQPGIDIHDSEVDLETVDGDELEIIDSDADEGGADTMGSDGDVAPHQFNEAQLDEDIDGLELDESH
ncbi:hypothetical protein FRB90_002733, partial [Tulasnella sp. 427]